MDAVRNGTSGRLAAIGGNLTVSGKVTGGGATIDQATFAFQAASNATVAFAGSTGVLELDAADAFRGTVAGLHYSAGNAIDLTGISFAGVQATFGHTGFLLADDGNNGTLVTHASPA